MFAVNHVQRRQQPRQFPIAIKQRSRQRIAGQAGAIEFATEPLLDLFQLRLEEFAQFGISVELLAGSYAQQHRQRRFQRMPKVAQGIA